MVQAKLVDDGSGKIDLQVVRGYNPPSAPTGTSAPPPVPTPPPAAAWPTTN